MQTTLPNETINGNQAQDKGALSDTLASGQWLGMSYTQIQKIQKIRKAKDKLAEILIYIGGVAVIAAVALIFFYLLLQILPLFRSAELSAPQHIEVVTQDLGVQQADSSHYLSFPAFTEAAYASVEEQFKVAAALFTDGEIKGQLAFYDLSNISTDDYQALSESEHALDISSDALKAKAGVFKYVQLPVIDSLPISSVAESTDKAEKSLLAIAQGSQVLFFRHTYEKEFSESETGELTSKIVPRVEYPYEESFYTVVPATERIAKMGLVHTSDALVVVSYTETGNLYLKQWAITEDLFGDGRSLEEKALRTLPAPKGDPLDLFLEPALQWLYLPNQASIEVYDLLSPKIYHSNVLVPDQIQTVEFLLGDISLLVGDQAGVVSQWFMVRNEGEGEVGHTLRQIRTFKMGESPIVRIEPEQRRKSFYVIDESGNLAAFYSTANREVFNSPWFSALPKHFEIAPRGNYLLYDSEGGLVTVKVANEHPEVSWSSLWQEVWYENYIEPDYIWQSSAANNDFEPKFSLTPLAFGTLKAAVYAMIVAVPLALCGAIYTAFFMAPAFRKKIKPTIEFMEALPTVILGFLAGLWLAPFVENNLPGIFTMLILMPISFIVFGYLWFLMPKKIRTAVPDGWQPLFLIPIVILTAILCIYTSGPIEDMLFEGSMRSWLTNEMGISFDQRNALVVGLAMGFAVIPTIYSIAEDALFAVPKNLSFGSLALGATPWQTMLWVILPTASPGIFSALMIGFGRAVGETMIVLMATGNTPIMDMNIFEGLRTLSANIAVEMPEAEVQSPHYRLLFLAAFVLFVITFCFNTTAEVVRQRLREKYGSL